MIEWFSLVLRIVFLHRWEKHLDGILMNTENTPKTVTQFDITFEKSFLFSTSIRTEQWAVRSTIRLWLLSYLPQSPLSGEGGGWLKYSGERGWWYSNYSSIWAFWTILSILLRMASWIHDCYKNLKRRHNLVKISGGIARTKFLLCYPWPMLSSIMQT